MRFLSQYPAKSAHVPDAALPADPARGIQIYVRAILSVR